MRIQYETDGRWIDAHDQNKQIELAVQYIKSTKFNTPQESLEECKKLKNTFRKCFVEITDQDVVEMLEMGQKLYCQDADDRYMIRCLDAANREKEKVEKLIQEKESSKKTSTIQIWDSGKNGDEPRYY